VVSNQNEKLIYTVAEALWTLIQ